MFSQNLIGVATQGEKQNTMVMVINTANRCALCTILSAFTSVYASVKCCLIEFYSAQIAYLIIITIKSTERPKPVVQARIQ